MKMKQLCNLSIKVDLLISNESKLLNSTTLVCCYEKKQEVHVTWTLHSNGEFVKQH